MAKLHRAWKAGKPKESDKNGYQPDLQLVGLVVPAFLCELYLPELKLPASKAGAYISLNWISRRRVF